MILDDGPRFEVAYNQNITFTSNLSVSIILLFLRNINYLLIIIKIKLLIFGTQNIYCNMTPGAVKRKQEEKLFQAVR